GRGGQRWRGGGDRGGVGRGLGRAVRAHPREPQRGPSRVTRRRLYAVERDLGYQLGPHVYDRVVATGRQLLQSRGLPRQHLVGETFERLADHHELLRVAIARAEVEVREPAATTTVSPLG